MNRRVVGAVVIAVALVAMTVSVANAHPGHGVVPSASDAHSLTHYVTEPFHAVGIVGSGALLTLAFITIAKRRSASQA